MMTPEQCKAARAWLDMDQVQLAKASGVALSTIRDYELRKRIPVAANVAALQRALEEAGAKFIDRDGEAVGLEVRPRITERTLIVPALKALAEMEDGFLGTSELIAALGLILHPFGEDLDILENRSDTRFSQIVRNMVSHRKSATNLIGAGYATYDKARRGLEISEKGRDYLAKHAESG